jgi:hypothetical protein
MPEQNEGQIGVRPNPPASGEESEMNFTESSRRQMDHIKLRTAARIIGIDVRTLRRWHRLGIGPTRRNIEHRRIFYSRIEVEQFAATYNSALRMRSPANGHLEADHEQTAANGHLEADHEQTAANGHLEIT